MIIIIIAMIIIIIDMIITIIVLVTNLKHTIVVSKSNSLLLLSPYQQGWNFVKNATFRKLRHY